MLSCILNVNLFFNVLMTMFSNKHIWSTWCYYYVRPNAADGEGGQLNHQGPRNLHAYFKQLTWPCRFKSCCCHPLTKVYPIPSLNIPSHPPRTPEALGRLPAPPASSCALSLDKEEPSAWLRVGMESPWLSPLGFTGLRCHRTLWTRSCPAAPHDPTRARPSDQTLQV